MKKKKEKENIIFINVDREGLLDKRPKRGEPRPKCMTCKSSIGIRSTWWYPGSEGYQKSAAKYYYDGIGYFCCRNCAIQYGIEAAAKELGHPEFNNIK